MVAVEFVGFGSTNAIKEIKESLFLSSDFILLFSSLPFAPLLLSQPGVNIQSLAMIFHCHFLPGAHSVWRYRAGERGGGFGVGGGRQWGCLSNQPNHSLIRVKSG